MDAAVGIDDISRLPDNVLELEGDDFYRFTKSISGELLTEVLKIQAIDSVFIFLQTSDIFEIFQHDSTMLQHLKSKIGFNLNDGTFQVKHGLQIAIRIFIKIIEIKIGSEIYKIIVSYI